VPDLISPDSLHFVVCSMFLAQDSSVVGKT
jgi:hypothetical protein